MVFSLVALLSGLSFSLRSQIKSPLPKGQTLESPRIDITFWCICAKQKFRCIEEFRISKWIGGVLFNPFLLQAFFWFCSEADGSPSYLDAPFFYLSLELNVGCLNCPEADPRAKRVIIAGHMYTERDNLELNVFRVLNICLCDHSKNPKFAVC